MNADGGEQANRNEIEGIRPTVLIGLGGTGGDVLLKVRKKVFERYGRPQDFPVLQYVYLDTDTSNQHIDSSLLADFNFGSGERYDAVIPDTAKYTRHLSQYPLIKAWWYPTTHDLGSLTVGAGQIRGYSRLGFYVNFSSIRNAIEMAVNSANASADVMLKRWGMPVETNRGANVYIIASVAGGTGSGMFLDTAYLCKTLGADISTVGFMVLPGIFLRNQERIFANSYAALKELEHFSFPGHDFGYEWTPGYPPRNMRPLPPPPFNYCYLIDSVNLDGKTVEFKTRYTLFEMIANSIFHDFGSSDFAAKKRSVRVNLDAHLNNFYAAEIKDPQNPQQNLLTEAFTTRQSAFGITSMQYPADRIKRALAAKLGADIMRRLATGKEPSGEFGKWVRETLFFKDLDLFAGNALIDGREVYRNDILDFLYRTDQPGRTLPSVIDDRITELQQAINSESYRVNNMTLSQFLKAQVEHILVNIRDENFEPDPQKWGDWSRWLRRNKEQFLKIEALGETNAFNVRTPSKLETAIGSIVNDPEKGIAYAKALLKELRRTLTDDAYPYIPTFNREATQLAGDIQFQQRTYQAKLAEIQKREHEGWLTRVMFGGAEIRQLTADFVNGLRSYLQDVVKQRARREAIEICQVILTRIGEEGVIDAKTGNRVGESGLSQELLALESSLDSLATDFDALRKEYSKPNEDQNTLFLYEVDDIDNRYYPKYMGETAEARTRKITERADELLKALPSAVAADQRGVKVMEVPKLIDKFGQKDTVKTALDICHRVFSTVQDDFEVLELFVEKYKTPQDQVRQLNLLYSKAQVWVEGSNQSKFELPLANRVLVVGMYNDPHKEKIYEGFKRLLRENVQKPNHPPMAIETISSKSEVIFYSEAAGYPLCFSQAVHDMRPVYETMVFDKFANLHADRHEHLFADILEMTEADREKLEEATRIFLLGLILSVISVTKDTDEDLVFKVQQKVGLNLNERSIGTQHRAVHVLLRDANLRSQIGSLVLQREDELKRDFEAWVKYYAVVSYYESFVYPPSKTEKVSKEHTYQATTESLVLRQKLKDIEAAMPAQIAQLEEKGRSYISEKGPTADFDKLAAIRLAEPFVAVKYEWERAAAVRV
jgi:hypothetical protein